MPPTASRPPRRFVILLPKFNKLTQLRSDKPPLFVTHFIAFIEELTGIGSNGLWGFFSVNHCPGAGEGCGELGTGPTAEGPGIWAVGELQGAKQGQSGLAEPLTALTFCVLCFRTMKIS